MQKMLFYTFCMIVSMDHTPAQLDEDVKYADCLSAEG